MVFRPITKNKEMANGMRNTSRTPLTDEEIEFVKREIRAINADETIFVFNDPEHIARSTCYDYAKDRVFVTRNVFPDDKYGSIHPRDIMSVRAVLAHEYYGHRTYRQEYLSDDAKGDGYHTTELWQDECRASITAAKVTPNLSEKDKCDLVQDAIFRADEAFHYIELDDFMKGVLYGCTNNEKNITPDVGPIVYVSRQSPKGIRNRFDNICDMPQVPQSSCSHGDAERGTE